MAPQTLDESCNSWSRLVSSVQDKSVRFISSLVSPGPRSRRVDAARAKATYTSDSSPLPPCDVFPGKASFLATDEAVLSTDCAAAARRGEARRGEARRGEARRGEARRGEARWHAARSSS